MIFRYAAPANHGSGGFSFPLNRATVTSFRRTRKYNGRGRRWLSVATMRVDGKITAADQDALTTSSLSYDAAMVVMFSTNSEYGIIPRTFARSSRASRISALAASHSCCS